MKNTTVKERYDSTTGTMQDVEHRHKDQLGPPLLRQRQGKVKNQRGEKRRQILSTVRSASSGRVARVERDCRMLHAGQRRDYLAGA